ncbi:MAG: histidine kinase dimerization/phospho-acceptor domain-containing protein, partial [Pseudomonadota bacterium]
MSRLFWKLFGLLWLAQVLPVFIVGFAAWQLQFRDTGIPTPPLLTVPPLPPLPVPFFLILAGSVVSAALSFFLAWQFSKPIKTLNAEFKALAREPLGERPANVFADRNDELSDLGAAFSNMSIRLKELIVGQRRLLHSVSHELRSPLSRIQAASDLLVQQPQRKMELVSRINTDVEKMDTLVSELLKMARLESGLHHGRVSRFRPVDVIDEIIDRVTFAETVVGERVHAHRRYTDTLQTDRGLFEHAVENLLKNAIRHTDAASRIDITVDTDASRDRVLVTVADNGPGVQIDNL